VLIVLRSLRHSALGDVTSAAPAVGAEGGEAEVVLLPVFTSAGIVRFDSADDKRFSFLVQRARRGAGLVLDPAASSSIFAA